MSPLESLRQHLARSDALLPLARLDAAEHQRFGAAGRPYCNNFIFLAESRIARGDYARLLARAEAA